jgi:hypothetical protein
MVKRIEAGEIKLRRSTVDVRCAALQLLHRLRLQPQDSLRDSMA